MKAFAFSLLDLVRSSPGRYANQLRGDRSLFVCGYPISGNTWIAYLLSYSLNIRYADVDTKEWPTARLPLKPLLIGANEHDVDEHYDCVLKTHIPPSDLDLGPHDAAVYVVRDGRDAVNSYFHRIELHFPLAERRIYRFLGLVLRAIPFQVRYSIIVRYLAELWANQAEDALERGLIIVRYEDLLVSPKLEIERLFSRLGMVVDRPVIDLAIERFSFANMRDAAVRSGGVATDRVGGKGDWRSFFGDSDRAWFSARFGPLLAQLGYDE